MEITINNKISNKKFILGSKLNLVIIPSEYSHPMLPGLSIKRTGGVATIQNYTIDNFRRSIENPVIKYVDAVNGLDTNNGDTADTAYKTVDKLRVQTFDRAYFAAGNYWSDNAGALIGFSREYIATGDVYFVRGFGNLTWTDVGDGIYSYSYHNTPTNVIDTYTKDSDGDPVRLNLVASLGEIVENTYYYDSTADLLYIKLTGSRVADNYVMFSINLTIVTSTKQLYFEGFQIFGGFYLEETNATRNTFAAKNCKFLHCYTSSAIRMNGNVDVWFENCVAGRARDDAFSYHANGSYHPAVVEIGCSGRNTGGTENNGLLNSSNNGSTLHESCVGLRINGNYFGTEGPVVHDSGQSKSLNIDTVAGESTSVLAANKSAFAVASVVGDTVQMWLDECTGGSETTFGAENRAPDNSHIYVKKSTITNVEEGTVLETY